MALMSSKSLEHHLIKQQLYVLGIAYRDPVVDMGQKGKSRAVILGQLQTAKRACLPLQVGSEGIHLGDDLR